jgi:hypothetical protein
MDLEYYEKIKYLFSIDIDDMRSILFLLILHSPHINYINIENDEFKIYFYDLLYETNKSNEIPLYYFQRDIGIYTDKTISIIQFFFKIEYNSIDITNNINEWKNATKITRLISQLEEYSKLKLNSSYSPSNATQFKFTNIQFILKRILKDIPPIKDLDILLINPIQQCFKGKKKYLDRLNNGIKCLDISRCKNMMKKKSYLPTITAEINQMDVCDATTQLIKFGFKYNDNSSVCFEMYSSWEHRMLELLQIDSINIKLKQYIELLLEKVNPIMLLKKQLNSTNYRFSIRNILNQYMKGLKKQISIEKYSYIESMHYRARFILNTYSILMKVFDNNIIFNPTNLSIYAKYYNKIYRKYILEQYLLLDSIENQLKIN